MNNAECFSYKGLDLVKIAGQAAARKTDYNITDTGFILLQQTRGESALVIATPTSDWAFTQEGLGTKNLVAEETGASLENAAWDTVAMIVNDLVTSGARPVVINPHWAVGDAAYFSGDRAEQLARGWAAACTEAGAIYGAGETPSLSGIINPGTIELSGSGAGIIEPKSRLVTEDNLSPGDHILLIASSGIHANGLTDARQMVSMLRYGYDTPLGDGRTFGEAFMTPTIIYSRLVQGLFENGIKPQYLVNITGHGWRKLMRPVKEFTYRMHTLTPVHLEFRMIASLLKFSPEKMYSSYNMGAGFAVFVDAADAERAVHTIESIGYKAIDAGVVESGPKQVIIEPLGISFPAESLNLR